MRRSREDTIETRRKIVEAASRLFRAKGIASVSVADVMGSLGLTVGGFYRHFDSKDALVKEAIEAASLESTRRQAPDPLAAYLSMAHRSHAEHGCPVAALCSEVAHETTSTKEAFTKALRRLLAAVDSFAPKDDKARRDDVLRTAASLVGAVALARATSDETLAEELLEAVHRGLDPTKRRKKKSPE